MGGLSTVGEVWARPKRVVAEVGVCDVGCGARWEGGGEEGGRWTRAGGKPRWRKWVKGCEVGWGSGERETPHVSESSEQGQGDRESLSKYS